MIIPWCQFFNFSLQCALILASCLCLFMHPVNAIDREFTVTILAGNQECFFEHAAPGQYIEIDYQVLDGSHGELDINFRLINPSYVTLISDYKKNENTHKHIVQEKGDYQICFDNSISYLNKKTVYFELSVDKEQSSEMEAVWDYEGEHLETSEDSYDMKIEDIKDIINHVRANTMKIKHYQSQFRAHEAKDRNLAESNFTKVNNWSIVQILIMMTVGGIQVVMLRSLFDDKSRVHRIWKMGRSS